MFVLSWRVALMTAAFICAGCGMSSRPEAAPTMQRLTPPAPELQFGDNAPDNLKLCVPDRQNAFLLREGWACMTLGELRAQLLNRRLARR